MKGENRMRKLGKLATALVVGCTIISTGIAAMASTQKTAGKDKIIKGRPGIERRFIKGAEGKGSLFNIEANLKALVSSGIITQLEADKILELSKTQKQARQAEMDRIKKMTEEERKAYFKAKKGQRAQKRENIFTKAVSEGIISQEKADAARAKLQEIHRAERTANITESLKGLVAAGTITQAQADKVIAYINTLEANKPAPGTLLKEGEKPFAERREKKNPLSELVDNGTLTQAQLDAITKVLPVRGGKCHGIK